MTSLKSAKALRFGAIVTITALLSSLAWSQGPAPDAPVPVVQPASAFVSATPTLEQHKFWDKENSVLFAASAAFSVADFAVTRANLQNGGKEMNPLVRIFGSSSAGLAANFIGENAGVVGLSYFFHKTGHHKLERVVSMVNIAGSAGAVSFGLANR
jgi:hypothetical protein